MLASVLIKAFQFMGIILVYCFRAVWKYWKSLGKSLLTAHFFLLEANLILVPNILVLILVVGVSLPIRVTF